MNKLTFHICGRTQLVRAPHDDCAHLHGSTVFFGEKNNYSCFLVSKVKVFIIRFHVKDI
jgi:hypothetical protein